MSSPKIFFCIVALSFPNFLFAITKKIIIDTDGVVDDARALTLALKYDQVQARNVRNRNNNDQIQVLAITTTASSISVDQATANVKRVLRLLNKQSVPVYKGADDGIIARKMPREDFPIDHGQDGLGDRSNVVPYPNSSDKQTTFKEYAAEAMARLARENKYEITLICLGPLTNVALAAKLDPEFKKNLREIFLIGGTLLGVGNHKSNPSSEYYFHMDPEAAHIVFSEFGTNTTGGRFRFIDEIVVATAYENSVALKTKQVPATVELHGWVTRGAVAIDWVNTQKSNVTFVTLYDTRKVLRMMEDAVEP